MLKPFDNLCRPLDNNLVKTEQTFSTWPLKAKWRTPKNFA